MAITSIARKNRRADGPRPYATWYEPLDERPSIDAAVAFALDRRKITGLATAGDTRLLSPMIEAERRHQAAEDEGADRILDAVSDTGSLFAHNAGRVVPDWLAHLLPSEQ